METDATQVTRRRRSFFPAGGPSTADFISVCTLIILFGYIIYSQTRQSSVKEEETISDEGVIPTQYEELTTPLPAIAFDLPKEISFAGEPVPLNIPDVRERLDKELQINCYLHSNTIFLIKRANRWLPQMQEILRKYDIPDDFKYLPLIESNLLNVTSYRDAVGYWQILESSGKELGLEITKEVDERYDPLKATEAAASYNRGMGGMERALEDQHVKSYYDLYLNDETSRYVFRILAIKHIIENPVKYGFKIDSRHLYQQEELKYVEVTETVKDLVSFSLQQGINYKLLKRHNPWLREDKLTVKKGKVYKIAIPA
jgi:membrane-bound lytic murein transglycosylase D